MGCGFSTFECILCEELGIPANNICLKLNCKYCTLCDFCSSKIHAKNHEMININHISSSFKNKRKNDIIKHKSMELTKLSYEIDYLMQEWENGIQDRNLKTSWLENLVIAITNYKDCVILLKGADGSKSNEVYYEESFEKRREVRIRDRREVINETGYAKGSKSIYKSSYEKIQSSNHDIITKEHQVIKNHTLKIEIIEIDGTVQDQYGKSCIIKTIMPSL